jgi:hypothetical protein
MKKFLIAVLLVAGLSALPAHACEINASVGKELLPYASHGEILGPGMVTLGCRYEHKVDFEIYWFGEQPTIYPGFTLKAYGGVGVSRVWEFKRRWFGTPELTAGLFFKTADRCKFNGDTNCNRRAPLPVNFLWKAGIVYADWRIEIGHISNNAMDWGPEAKNLGQNFARLNYRFR